MSATSALYLFTCEEEGCVAHSDLVKLFHAVDVATKEKDRESPVGSSLPPPHWNGKLISFAPNLCYPTHVDVSNTYLGDVGLAAFFGVLPMMRWLQQISAQNVGAGQRSVDALCRAILYDLKELPSRAVEDRVRSLPALVEVDLRRNDAIFALSGDRLVKALKRRLRYIERWAASRGVDTTAAPPLEVLVDTHQLPTSIEIALSQLNTRSVEIKRQRAVEQQYQCFLARLSAFTTVNLPQEWCRGAGVWGASGPRPIGQEVIFRLPHPPASSSSQPRPLRDEVVERINETMELYLVASRIFACGTDLSGAVQVCVDFGPDVLAFLPHTNAAVWYMCGSSGRYPVVQPEGGANLSATAKTEETPMHSIAFWEAKANVAALLRAFDANKNLEEELCASALAGGTIIRRHLHRLRHLYAHLQCPTGRKGSDTTEPADASDASTMEELVALYYRVTAGLVTQRFSATHIPSMVACEAHLHSIRSYMLDVLLKGELTAEALEAAIQRLNRGIYAKLILGDKPSGSPEDQRVLPPLLARAFYHQHNHPAQLQAWVSAYDNWKVGDDIGETSISLFPSTDAFSRCTCLEMLATYRVEAAQRTVDSKALPRPCPTCCFKALCAVDESLYCSPAAISSDEAVSDQQAYRSLSWSIQQRLLKELRVFFFDMMIRQRSRARGGCAYLPNLGNLLKNPADGGVDEEATSSEKFSYWTPMQWLGCAQDQSQRVAQVLDTFNEWYRLRALESYGMQDKAAQLFAFTDVMGERGERRDE